jgi:hypothetical protein
MSTFELAIAYADTFLALEQRMANDDTFRLLSECKELRNFVLFETDSQGRRPQAPNMDRVSLE